MNEDEKGLINALKYFYRNHPEKIAIAARKLNLAGDLSKEGYKELISDGESIETRAKTVMPEPEMSNPPEYDGCGNMMTAAEVMRGKERIANQKRERKEREEIERIHRMPDSDGCDTPESYC